jgi:hypothetical protein
VLLLRVVDRHGPGPGEPEGVPVIFWVVVVCVAIVELVVLVAVWGVMTVRYLR